MFRQFKHLAMRLKACKASILSNIRLCRAKADAHEKHRYMFSRLQEIRMQALVSLSLSLSKFANSLDPEDIRRLAKSNQGQTGYQELIM